MLAQELLGADLVAEARPDTHYEELLRQVRGVAVGQCVSVAMGTVGWDSGSGLMVLMWCICHDGAEVVHLTGLPDRRQRSQQVS